MTLPNVPLHHDLFAIAVATAESCRSTLGDDAESAISPLAVAAFQLQAAQIGARVAAMATDGECTQMLRTIVTDSEGAFSVALNLSTRCSATVVDLCAASLGRLLVRSTSPDREMDAADIERSLCKSPAPVAFAPLVDPYLGRVRSPEWAAIVNLRHAVTHKVYKRGVYATTRLPPETAPLAYPQQNDVEWGGQMVPMDAAAVSIVTFAEDTFREFCTNLVDLGPTG